MKYGIWKFFNRKNAVVYIALPLTVLALIISITAFALTNRKQPYPVTSFGKNPNFSYKLYFDQFNNNGEQTQTSVNVNQKLLQDALKKLGATKSRPLPIFSKLMEDAISGDKLAWLEALKHNLQCVTDGLMDFSWEARTGTTVPMLAWKTDGNCPSGYMSWLPDYNGPGTWFEPYFLLKKDGSDGFSSWSAWTSVYKHLCFINSVVKNSKNKDYKNIKEFNGWSTQYATGKMGSKDSDKPQTENYFDIGEDLIKYLQTSGIVKCDAFNKPTSPEQRQDPWYWEKLAETVFKNGGSTQLSAKIGSWVNAENYHALWLERVMDNQMAFIPTSQNRYLTTTSLRSTWLLPRNNDTANYRDYGKQIGSPHNSISLANPDRIFDRTITPLNPCFQDWPVATYYNSTLGTLLTWVAHGNVSGLDKSGKVITPNLYLQTAKAVVMYDCHNCKIGVIFRDQKSKAEICKKYCDGLEKVPSFCGKVDLGDRTLKGILSKATHYEFSIDTDLHWIDNKGNVKDKLDAKDLQRGLEAYWLSSAGGLNINNYFFDMSGVDIQKTLENGQTNINNGKFSFEDILSPNFDINKYQSGVSDQRFSFYLKNPYPMFLDVLSKESFSPLPHKNWKVKNIATTQQTIDASSKAKGKVVLRNNQIDNVNTNFNQIFGSGSNFEDILNQYWTVGPYTVSKMNGGQVVFSRNKTGGYYGKDMSEMPWYKRSHGGDDGDKEDPIDQVIFYYGSGNESVYFEKFAAGQLDYVTLQTLNKILAAYANKRLANSILTSTPWKTFMSNYIVYTGYPYRNENGRFVKQSNLSEIFYRWMQWWNDDTKVKLDGYDLTRSDVAKIIRSVFFGLINFAQLSRIQNSSGSFQYSIVPYGTMKLDYIEKDEHGKESLQTAELYHYINNHKFERPGAMLNTLDQYISPLTDPCPFIPTGSNSIIKEGE